MANESDVRAMRAENEQRLAALTIPEVAALRIALRTLAGDMPLLQRNTEDNSPARYVKALLDFGDAVRRVHS